MAEKAPTKDQAIEQLQQALDGLKAARTTWAQLYAANTDDLKMLQVVTQTTQAIQQTTNAVQQASGGSA